MIYAAAVYSWRRLRSADSMTLVVLAMRVVQRLAIATRTPVGRCTDLQVERPASRRQNWSYSRFISPDI